MDVLAAESLLRGTPYLFPTDASSLERLSAVRDRSLPIRDKALDVARGIREHAKEVMEPFETAVISDLVAESNRIEGYEWSSDQVKTTVVAYRELLMAPVHNFVEVLRNDARVFEALGLYRAHLLAEEWAREQHRPAEYEIRALHSLIAAGEPHAGRYKLFPNRIGGSGHRPADPWDVADAMRNLTIWWEKGTGDPILDATVVHAWLTHVHPFEDGNGRMARLLANLALVQSDYPPLLVRSTTDREEYYGALADSDAGDILPLWDLFSRILRRTVKTMARKDYVRDVINDRLLVGTQQRHHMWMLLAEQFAKRLRSGLRRRDWEVIIQGYPDVSAFALLVNRDPDGNSWYVKIRDRKRQPRWLLWYGFNSDALLDAVPRRSHFPSIFFSFREEDPASVHPYRTRFMSGDSPVPCEVVLIPGEIEPVILRWNKDVEQLKLDVAADRVSEALLKANET
jgi:Fic family protein